MTVADIEALPDVYGRAACRARDLGFSGIEIHAAHGFLLSQFLSPVFNHRRDGYGGSVEARSRLLLEVIDQVRRAVSPSFAIGVKINATDELVGGFDESDSLVVIEMLGQHGVDLIDISGGTYFPGAASSSDRPSSGPYYTEFARRARRVTDTALMLTGGIKTRSDAEALIADGVVDLVGLARPLVLDPDLPNNWTTGNGEDPVFPRFESSPPGGVTAWYTMQLTSIAHGNPSYDDRTPDSALIEYDERDTQRALHWQQRFERR
jgi:2,4-dienoyl-CoA reductase-like NADH-dependent reductase (Old Yellow Enzyme family)